MKSNQVRHNDYRGTDSKPYSLSSKSYFGGQPPKTPTNLPHAIKDNKGKGIAGESSKWSNSVTCHHCHRFGHIAHDCPTRNLCIEDVEGESDPIVDDYIPDFVPSDDDCDGPEDWVSFLRFAPSCHGDENALSKTKGDPPHVMVVRCALTLQENEDWRRTSIFHTYVKCNDKSCKVIIDSGSCTNVASANNLSRLVLTLAPHPKPYRVSWVDSTSIPVTQPYCDVMWSPWMWDILS